LRTDRGFIEQTSFTSASFIRILSSGRPKARERAASAIEYVATVPEFYDAINSYVAQARHTHTRMGACELIQGLSSKFVDAIHAYAPRTPGAGVGSGQILVKYWSNTGQILVKYWSDVHGECAQEPALPNSS
jgi:hypothetical protein